jgi:hypothetical protein
MRRKLPPIIWQGSRLSRRDLLMVRSELVELMETGLRKPADLIFHEVWLDDDPYGRIVSVWGRVGRRSFCAAFIPARPNAS